MSSQLLMRSLLLRILDMSNISQALNFSKMIKAIFRKYILDMVKDFNMSNLSLVNCSLPTPLKLILLLSQPEIHTKLIGKILYFYMTRPDVYYVVQHLSPFVSSSPRITHFKAVIHLLRYIKGSTSLGLFYLVWNI